MSTKRVRQGKTLIDELGFEPAIFHFGDECFTDEPQGPEARRAKKF